MIRAIIVILVVIAIVIVASNFLDYFWSSKPSEVNEVPTATPCPIPESSQPVFSPTPSTTPSVTPSASPLPTLKDDIKFAFTVTDISGSGLSRTITTQITNTGSADAHDTWAKVEVFSQGSRIKLGGNDYLKEDIGTIKSGMTITKTVALVFSVLDGLKIANNGATFTLIINSGEHTETFTYEYYP